MTCPFCDSIKTKQERILKETERAFVILSNPRLMRGHALIIPKRHVGRLVELRDEERKELLDMVVEFEEKILKHIAPGCDLRQNYRPFIPQNDLKIDHFHFHLQPRSLNDEFYTKVNQFDKPLFRPLPQNEADEVAKLLV